MPVSGAARLIKAQQAASGVRWLIDTEERMMEYLDLAQGTGAQLTVAAEIDIGIRRGGRAPTRS